MYYLGMVEKFATIPYWGGLDGRANPYGSQNWVTLYEPSMQLVYIAPDQDPSHVEQYYLPIPWMIVCSQVNSYSARINTINFCKGNPLEGGMIYRPFLPNCFWSSAVWSIPPLVEGHILATLCGTYTKFNPEADKLTKIATLYAAIWSGTFKVRKEYHFTGHPMVQEYGGGEYPHKVEPLYQAWEAMTLEELCAKNWGDGIDLDAYAKRLDVTLELKEFFIEQARS